MCSWRAWGWPTRSKHVALTYIPLYINKCVNDWRVIFYLYVITLQGGKLQIYFSFNYLMKSCVRLCNWIYSVDYWTQRGCLTCRLHGVTSQKIPVVTNCETFHNRLLRRVRWCRREVTKEGTGEFHNLYSSRNVIRKIISGRMTLVGNVAP